MLLPSLTGVVEAASDIKVSNTEKLVASQKAKTEENKNKAQEPKKEFKEENKDESKEKPQLETKEAEKEIRPDEREKAIIENTDESDNDGLEISDENVAEAVRGTIPAPTIGKVFYDATSISGANVQRKKVKGVGTIRSTVYVTLKDKNGNEKATASVTPTSGTTWTVDLPNNIKVAAGDTVTAYQTLDGSTSDVVTANAEPSIAGQTTLTMPTGEIWIEKTNANIVSDDEQTEAFDMLKNSNPDIAKDFKEVKFSIDGTDHAYYEVTYTDGSTSGKIEATDLKIKTITETSAAPTIEKVQVTDGQIIVTFEKEVAAGTKFYFIKEFTDGEENSFCQNGNCTPEKTKPQEMSQAVSVDGKTVTFPVKNDDLELKRTFGIIVKEPHKFRSCAKSEPVITTPAKVAVRDPHKLTDDDKKAIDKAIRDANTVNGKSKLPDGTGFVDVSAFIEFDKEGNVTIISPNDVESNDWDSDGNPIYEKNPDGTYKVNDGAKVFKISSKDLVKNIKPYVPTLGYDKTKGEIAVTPDPADTDAKKVEVTYTGKDGNSKTVTATKGEGGTWTTDDAEVKVDENGVVTLPTSKVKSNTTVKAKVTDDGGISQTDAEKKSSEDGSVVIKASVQTPTVTVDKTTGDVTVTPKYDDPDAKRLFITYTPAGSDTEKTVIANKGNDDKWSITGESDFEVSAYGKSFTIKNANAKGKTQVKAITKGEKDDLFSATAEATVPDKTAPKAPEVKVNTTDGSAQITPPSDADTKTVTVKYPGADGAEKTAIATKDDDGWTITEGTDDGVTVDSASGLIKIPYDKMKKADTVSATAKDDSGNESKSSTDTTLPPVPSVEVNTDKKVVVTPPADTSVVNGMEITYTPAGESQAKTIKITKGNDGNWKLEGDPITGISVDENSGTVTFDKGTAKDLSNVTAKSKIDENKIGLETAEKQVPDTTAPEKPEVKVQEDGSVTITPKKDSDTKTVTVTYKDNEGNDKTATATKGDDGEWTVTGDNGETIDKTSGVITIPKGKSNPGDKVEAKAKDPSNNESGPSDDTTMPAPPTVTPDQKSGNVTITPPTKGNLDGMDIEYKTPDNTNRKVRVVKGTDKKWKIEGDNPDGVTVAEDTGLVTIPQGKAKEKTEVKADSTLGEKKAPAEKTPDNQNLVPDKTAPNPPAVEVDTKTGNITITPPKDEDTTSVTVTYKDKNGTAKTPKAKKGENGKWTLENNTNGEGVDENSGVITIPKGNYKTEQPITAYGNDNVDNKSDVDNKTPVEVTFDKNGGSKDIAGSILVKGGSYVLPAIYDKQFFPLNKEFKAWEVDGKEVAQNTEIKISKDTVVKAIWKDKTSDQPGVDKPNTPEAQSPEENEIPEIKIRDHYTPTFPVYVTVPKTEKVERAEEVPVSLETHKAYIAGYEDNTLRAEGNLTRAEAAAMVTRLAGLDLSDTSMPAFKDMQKNAWYFRYINAAVKAKMLDADNGMMRPNDKITRAEFAKMLAAIDKENSSVSKFDDIKGHRYEKEINKIYGNNRIEGYEDGSFRPDAYLTRAESAAFLNRMFNRIADKEAYAGLEDKLAKFKDFDASKWYYDEMVEATNSHELTRRGKTSDKFGRVYEKWTRILPSDVK